MIHEGFIHDREGHTYRLNGRGLISITDTFDKLGISDFSMVDPGTLAEAQAIGNAVDAVTEDFDRTGDRKTALCGADQFSGYLEAWIAFRQQYEFTPDYIEQPWYHKKYLYAGRLDRAGAFGRLDKRRGVVQIKSCPVRDYVALQTAAEMELYRVNGNPHRDPDLRMGVQLYPNGLFKERVFDDPSDLSIFLGMHRAAVWVINHRR